MPCEIIGGCFDTERELTLAQVLPAAGAFTSQAFTTLQHGAARLAFWIQYDRGAAGGYPALRIEFTNGTEVARTLVLDRGSLVVVQPNGSFNVDLEELLGPAPADDNVITYVLEATVPSHATGVRLLAAERGQPGTPGTISVALTTTGGC